jgi:3,4-dihydroxy 2-butanone 4-phosphate synthase / GTP cyclohydrolase II
MARLPELVKYAKEHDLKLISIADLISYRLQHDRFVYRESVCQFPSQFGEFKIYAYRNALDNTEHLAIVKGDPSELASKPALVRMHSECLTGDALGSMRCDCRMQLQSALKMIEAHGLGVVVYLRQEGRGIGLVNKLKAYTLQDMGLDTVEANERLGFPADLRDYGMGAQILNDLSIKQIRLITNNPRKIAGLKGYGLEIVDRLPLLIEATDYNSQYLATKAQKLGHLLLQTYLVTVAIAWSSESISPEAQQEKLDKIRYLAKEQDFLVQEEARPIAIALFSNSHLIFHLGFDQPNLASATWYQDCTHPYLQGVLKILDQLTDWQDVSLLEFLIAPGDDPMSGLQIKLDRQYHSLSRKPSQFCNAIESQKIYSLSSNNN